MISELSTYHAVDLSEIADISIGKTPSRSNSSYWGNGMSWVSIADLKNVKEISNTKEQITQTAIQETRIKVVPKGTILFSFKLSIGKVAFTGKDIYTNEAIAAILVKDKSKIDNQFLYYVLKEFDFTGTGDKAVMGLTLNQKKLKVLQIPLPPLETQKKIAAILDKADALRQNDKQILKKYDQLTQSIFLDMFGDPVINPKGWEVLNIRKSSLIMRDGPFGSNLKTEHYRPFGVRVIRLKNIGINKFIDLDEAFVSEEHYETISKHTCLPGDVLVATLGDPNVRACKFPKEIDKAINKADCVQIRPNPEVIIDEYLVHLLNLPATLHWVANLLHGQTRTRVSMGQLSTLNIPIPPINLQNQFGTIVEQIEKQKQLTQQSLQKSEELFQSLLQRAFRGELA